MIPKVYVAGPSSELDRCKRWMAELESEGIPVTHDWTLAIERERKSTPLDEHEYRMHARRDLIAIDEATIIWILTPIAGHTRGAWFEAGYAFANLSSPSSGFGSPAPKKAIVVSPPVGAGVIFMLLPGIEEFYSDQLALEWILRASV